MDYEKKYKEALERARQFSEHPLQEDSDSIVEYIFPELKESEDERIRKAIKKALQVRCDGSRIISDEPVTLKEAVAWLEKQGEQKSDNKFIRMRETKPKDISEFLDRLTTVEQEFLWEHIAKIRELDKEEQKPVDKVEPKFKIGQWMQNLAWSEKDEHWRQKAIDFMKHPDLVKATPTLAKDTIGWLKSLKDRVLPQPKWSEEDERNIQDIDSVLFYDKGLPEDTCIRLRNWLESLRPQSQWKPSDEQMDVLLSEVTAWTKGCPKQIVLESLYQDLKKLREE